MKNIISVWVVVSFLFGGYCYAAVSEIVIAKVGSVEITTFELKREIQRILPFNKTFHGGVSQEKLKEIRQIAFDRLMESAYKVRYALLN
ncbi:MAG: SurA N-terminal domain-containing protein, partial [Desulfobulbaceae bacterium]|nr:SurA N-terminal domain-containing protein [Desulfobulbaceae bacterium]